MNEVNFLQLGKEDYSKIYSVPSGVTYYCVEELTEIPKEGIDVVLINKRPSDGEIDILSEVVRPYCLYVVKSVHIGLKFLRLYSSKMGKRISEEDLKQFIEEDSRFFYPNPYGEKYDFKNLAISDDFVGNTKWNGNVDLTLMGNFGSEFHQIAFFRNNIPLFKNQVIDLWLEYSKDENVSVELEVIQFRNGTVSDVRQRWIFSEEELDDIVRLDSGTDDGYIFVSIRAKGEGYLKIVALHDRYSRGRLGFFLPGGERYVTEDREEIFSYFEPGDMMPPLNIYFSGYKTKEGFEGVRMMQKLGSPFLLISEPRLEGGNFYMGSEEFEKTVADIIKRHMADLDFSGKDVIMSGLSMGTYGALFYGCDISPHALILGKPLVSVGDIAVNEKKLRPGGFATSLDVLLYHCGEANEEQAQLLNDRFWTKFESSDFGETKFVVAYMIEDDYDANGYSSLLSHLNSNGVQVYGKGIHGRHNDNTNEIVKWFLSQFKNIMYNDYSKRV